MKLDLFYPIRPNTETQGFGSNPDYYKSNYGVAGHNGIDFVAAHGDPVYAAHDGICYPEIDNSGGNGVVIRTQERFEYGALNVFYKSIYWHLVKADSVVHYGQIVKAGDLIGYADNTGKTTGDHLHFGLKPCDWNETEWTWYNTEQSNGYNGAIDPTPYFNGFYATDAQKVLTKYESIVQLLTTFISSYKKTN